MPPCPAVKGGKKCQSEPKIKLTKHGLLSSCDGGKWFSKQAEANRSKKQEASGYFRVFQDKK